MSAWTPMERTVRLAFLWMAGTLLGMAMPGAIAAQQELSGRIDAAVSAELAAFPTPGASVAVFDREGMIAAFGAGLADIEADTPADENTIYPAMSLSKLLTATLVMQDVEHGTLSLDDNVNLALDSDRMVRDASGRAVVLSMRQLLSHTSGIPTAFARGLRWPDDGPQALDDYLAGGLVATRPPGEKLVYSNDAYALAGWLSARAAGETFAAHAQHSILQPLGMNQSSFDPAELTGVFAAAYGAAPGDDSRTDTPSLAAQAPAASLRTTVVDLSKFGRMLLRGGELDGRRLLDPRSIEEMWRVTARIQPDQPDGFGLGFAVLERGDRTRIWWDGLGPGATARLALWPSHNLGLVVLSNHSDPSAVAAISQRVESLLMGTERLANPSQDATQSLERLAGDWIPEDMIEPALWFLRPLTVVRVSVLERQAEFKMPGWRATSLLLPRSRDHFRVHGSLFDGYTAVLKNDRLYLGWLEFRRPVWYETRTAVFTAIGVLTVTVLVLLGWILRWLWRRSRRTWNTSR